MVPLSLSSLSLSSPGGGCCCPWPRLSCGGDTGGGFPLKASAKERAAGGLRLRSATASSASTRSRGGVGGRCEGGEEVPVGRGVDEVRWGRRSWIRSGLSGRNADTGRGKASGKRERRIYKLLRAATRFNPPLSGGCCGWANFFSLLFSSLLFFILLCLRFSRSSVTHTQTHTDTHRHTHTHTHTHT